MNKGDQGKEKTLLLSLPTSLYTELSAWAGEELCPVGEQMEALLSACVRQRRGSVEDKNDLKSHLLWLLQVAAELLRAEKEGQRNG